LGHAEPPEQGTTGERSKRKVRQTELGDELFGKHEVVPYAEMSRVLFIFGTRPEAIKLSPVIRHMKSRPDDFNVRVCVTAQHRELLDQVLHAFNVAPDRDLDIMRPGQTLSQSTSRIIAALEPVLAEEKPDIVLVQGDTTSTFCGALAAFYAKIPVGHVEAGLRTGDPHEPFPEEMNRVLTGRIATFHFAPTEGAAQNLYCEGVDAAAVTITGNTGIDAVLHVKQSLDAGKLVGLDGFRPDASKKLIVVTAHRRESFGDGFDRICSALVRLAQRDDVEMVYPVHPNPNVRAAVNRHLAGRPNITVLDPLDYVRFVDLMRRAYLLLTDSGGIQEEAPSLGKPVLVLREKTERPEAVSAGTARLVGTDERRIVEEAERLLDDPHAYQRMARRDNPYGDGKASERIADVLAGGTAEFARFRLGNLVPVEIQRQTCP
jgi:UDP-N-acetylglucosamine 2-epimerase (non-hydrolysing)